MHRIPKGYREYFLWYLFFSFVIFSTWEWMQTPFFIDITDEINRIVWFRFHCTIGDMMILTSTMLIASLLLKDIRWIFSPERRHYIIVSTMAVGYTFFSEFKNVHLTHGWDYSPYMPTLFGLGLVPIIQWILLPSLILYVTKRFLR